MAAKKRRKPLPASSEQVAQATVAPNRARQLALLIVAAGVVAYLNSFSGVFVLDDVSHISQNTKIESFEPVSKFLGDRRPLVTLSLAVNYALGKRDPSGYHLFNLAVHLCAGLTLFGVVHRTLRREPLRGRYAAAAPWLAGVVALIWVVHPLQTQSVTYVVQRAESMMGLFYLLTLYCFIRATDSPRSSLWHWAAVAACAAGMFSKAVMLTAPVMILAYDLLFVAPSLAAALRRRWPLYLGLGCTWYLLVVTGVAPGVLNTTPNVEATVGFSHTGVTPLDYALTQPGVILHYLRLALWPDPLCLDYHWPIAQGAGAIIGPGVVLVALLGGTVWALGRRSWLGFAGLWFFLILSPTSSFIPIKDAAFEHRMYLPLAAVVTAVVLVGHGLACRGLRSFPPSNPVRRWVLAALAVLVVAPLVYGTIRRNSVYRSELSMYRDVIRTRPNNARAHNNLGTYLRHADRPDEAVEAYEAALRADPEFASAHHNIAAILEERGQLESALESFRQALEIQPERSWRHFNLANCLAKLDRLDEAIAAYHVALGLEPNNYDTHLRLASVLMMAKRPAEAIEEYRLAIKANPREPRARYHCGLALQRAGRLHEAADAFRGVLELAPGRVNARSDLGVTLMSLGQVDEAIAEYRRVLAQDPRHVPARYNLGLALQRLGQLEAAAVEYRAAVQLQPDYADAHCNLGIVLNELGRVDQAIGAFRTALVHDPDHGAARYNLGLTFYDQGRLAEAIEQFRLVPADDAAYGPATRAAERARRGQP